MSDRDPTTPFTPEVLRQWARSSVPTPANVQLYAADAGRLAALNQAIDEARSNA